MIESGKIPERRRLIDGDEQDALTRWSEYLRWRPGQRKKIKNRYNRRWRRTWKYEEMQEW
jgi:hypothetical protein